MKVNKKQIIWGSVLGALGLTAIWVNKQIKKINDFSLDFKKIKVNKFTIEELDFNTYYDYNNKSDIDINLSSQEYDLYVNETYITTMTNYTENVLKANSVSSLGFNTKINLPELDKKIRLTYFNMIADPKAVKLKIVMRWKVRLGFIKIPVKYTWNTDLKEILGWYLPIYRK
jgi:LEA14-like dessication related protein